MKIVDCEQCKGDGCPNCDSYGYYAVHETRLTTGGKPTKIADKPRFTEDEIQQWNKEAMQIYHAKNIALAEKVAAWQALGRELVDWFKPRYSAETGDLGLMLLGYFPETHPLYIAFKRLLELTSD